MSDFSFSFDNYKFFDKTMQFSLAPITILTGTNSSGKSSLTFGLQLVSDLNDKLEKTDKNEIELGVRDLMKIGTAHNLINKNNGADTVFNITTENDNSPSIGKKYKHSITYKVLSDKKLFIDSESITMGPEDTVLYKSNGIGSHIDLVECYKILQKEKYINDYLKINLMNYSTLESNSLHLGLIYDDLLKYARKIEQFIESDHYPENENQDGEEFIEKVESIAKEGKYGFQRFEDFIKPIMKRLFAMIEVGDEEDYGLFVDILKEFEFEFFEYNFFQNIDLKKSKLNYKDYGFLKRDYKSLLSSNQLFVDLEMLFPEKSNEIIDVIIKDFWDYPSKYYNEIEKLNYCFLSLFQSKFISEDTNFPFSLNLLNNNKRDLSITLHFIVFCYGFEILNADIIKKWSDPEYDGKDGVDLDFNDYLYRLMESKLDAVQPSTNSRRKNDDLWNTLFLFNFELFDFYRFAFEKVYKIKEINKINPTNSFFNSTKSLILDIQRRIQNLDLHYHPNFNAHLDKRYVELLDSKNKLSQILNTYLENKNENRDAFVKKWIQEFDIADDFEVKKEEQLARLYLTKNESNFMINDEGMGTGKLIPILLHIASIKVKDENKKRSYLVIEEPESNLHPALQSKLADMFVDAYEQFGLRIIIETHSEYLIRKLQFIIARGYPEKIEPSDVQIYYFYHPNKVPDGEKQIYPIEIKKDGRLTKNFGKGFLDESMKLGMLLFNSSNN